MPAGLPQCPYCQSQDIEPVTATSWHCNTCGNDFAEAAVEEVPEKK